MYVCAVLRILLKVIYNTAVHQSPVKTTLFAVFVHSCLRYPRVIMINLGWVIDRSFIP